MAEHLVAKGMLSADMLPSRANSRGAGAPSPVDWKAGRRQIGAQKIYARSAWEANVGRYLEWLRERGEIAAWVHEKTTFWFERIRRGVRSYLPDFEVTEQTGATTFYEVKGHLDSKSKTKLRRLKKYYPSVRMVIVGVKSHAKFAHELGYGFIAYADIAKFAGLIAGWE